jgi:hypothetical protein
MFSVKPGLAWHLAPEPSLYFPLRVLASRDREETLTLGFDSGGLFSSPECKLFHAKDLCHYFPFPVGLI